MTNRLATICLVAMSLSGLAASSVRAQDNELTRASLKGISAVFVLVEDQLTRGWKSAYRSLMS